MILIGKVVSAYNTKFNDIECFFYVYKIYKIINHIIFIILLLTYKSIPLYR